MDTEDTFTFREARAAALRVLLMAQPEAEEFEFEPYIHPPWLTTGKVRSVIHCAQWMRGEPPADFTIRPAWRAGCLVFTVSAPQDLGEVEFTNLEFMSTCVRRPGAAEADMAIHAKLSEWAHGIAKLLCRSQREVAEGTQAIPIHITVETLRYPSHVTLELTPAPTPSERGFEFL